MHKLRIIPNTVDCSVFRPIKDDSIRKQWRIPENAKVILFVVRLDVYKGCECLVRAFFRVSAEVNNARLLLVGRGPGLDSLARLSCQLGIQENVIFAGYVSDRGLPYCYAGSDLLVPPSVWPLEGFRMVQLEAMAYGKPVVTTTLPGPASVDEAQVASIHVKPRSEVSVAQAIVRVLNDPALAQRLSRNGRPLWRIGIRGRGFVRRH